MSLRNSKQKNVWLQNETFKTWLQKNPGDLYKATCKVYAKDISISLHGSAVLFSHAHGTKHKERLQKDTPVSFLKQAEPL